MCYNGTMKEYRPLRCYIKLEPDTSKALGEKAARDGIDDPRKLAADLVRTGLGLASRIYNESKNKEK